MTELAQMPRMPRAVRPPQTTTSADGTLIAYDVHGDPTDGLGPVVVMVGGATMTRVMEHPLGEALAAAGTTAVSYDRRARGDSGDTAPYAVQREVEDLLAVVEAVRPGASVVLLGFSSGAALALQALATGAPALVGGIAFEPPYRLPDSPPVPDDYVDALEAFVARDDLDGALGYFQTAAIGTPPEIVAQLRESAGWADFAATARSLPYDGHCLGGNDQSFPTELVAGVEQPVVAVASTGSPSFLTEPARLVGVTAPRGEHVVVDGGFHHADEGAIVALVVDLLDRL